MSTGRSTGDELRLLGSDREITAGRRRIARTLVAVVGIAVIINGLSYSTPTDPFGLAGALLGVVLACLGSYWLLLRALSQSRTSDLCPQCGEEHIEHPISGVASEPDAPYCPAPGCEWTGEA